MHYKNNSDQRWRTIAGKTCFFRSKWEANYARYLQFLSESGVIERFEYEPTTFWFEKIKRGVRCYKPDFKVYKPDGSHYWVEVKGWLDSRSKTKINRFRKHYPKETLLIIDKKWFSKNNPKAKLLCKDWE